MKKHVSTALVLTVAAMVAAAQHHTPSRAETIQVQAPVLKDAQVNQAFSHYLSLKEALVQSRPEEAVQASHNLVLALQGVKNAEQALAAARVISKNTSLQTQRKFFADLSQAMTAMVKRSGVVQGFVFLDYCPMANGNEGGYWLSAEKEIRNPYFGEQMLRCGNVKEEIKP